jgi:tRNA(Arg) A34 adenosine deaminase TadA
MLLTVSSPVPGSEQQHLLYLRRCIEAVRSATDAITYPQAAAVGLDGELLALQTSRLPGGTDPSAHPEMEAIRSAAARIGSRYLHGAVLYSTVEPCPMCTSVAIWARMQGIVYGASQAEVVAFAQERSTPTLTWRQIRIGAAEVTAAGEPHLWVVGGVLREECLSLLNLTQERTRRQP